MSLAAAIAVGVLAGSLFLAGATVGAGVLRLIGRLTGGGWSETAVLERLASLSPIPVLCAVAARAALALQLPSWPGPAAPWREAAVLDVRLVLIAAAWIWIAWLSGRRPSRAISGVALLVFGVSVSIAAFDLVLSLEPGWTSSAEGMALAVRMLGSALAAAVLAGSFGPGPQDVRNRRDLQGLLAATLLATLYLNLMTYLVPWYGDLPDKTAWIRQRLALDWTALIAAALGLGAVLPLPILALTARLGDRARRIAAGLALGGFVGQTVWLLAPPFGSAAGLVAVGTAVLGGALGAWRTSSRRAIHAL